MKAAVFRGPRDLNVEEIPYPELPSDGVILKVEACGICGSDLRTYEHGMRVDKAWQVLGHEIAGVVAEVGENVSDYEVGNRLAIAADVHCHECYYCRRALYNLCEDWKLLGAHYPGGLAEYMQLPKAILRRGIVHRTPDRLSSVAASLAEPASSVLASQYNIGVEVGETVVIFGAGPIGCLHIEVAKARGARPIVIELVPERLAFAEALGVEEAILVEDQDVVADVRSLTDGLGPDVAIIAAPAKVAQAQAVEMVRKRGRVVLFGGLPKVDPITHLDSNIIHYNELTIFGAFSYHPRFHQLALEMLARAHIRADRIITGTYPLAHLLDAFEAAKSGTEVKAVITPH